MSDTSKFPKQINKQSIVRWGLGLGILVLILSGCYVAARQLAGSQEPPKQRPAPVSPERSNLPITISANGTVEPIKVVNVSPKTF
jgi:HlyD family secretion protein